MYFSGRVHTVVYDDPAKAFYILKMVLDEVDDGIVSVKGSIPGMPVKIGTWFGFEASWVKHKSYGDQLSISKAPVLKSSWDVPSAVHALVSYGVGERVVASIREFFGEDDFIPALGKAESLEEVPGLDSFTALYVHQRWTKVQAYFKGLAFLLDLRLPPAVVKRVWSMFGDDVADVLGANPWALTKVNGISFHQADEIAKRLGVSMDSPARLQGLIVYVSKSRRQMGHMYMSTPQLAAEVGVTIADVPPKELGAAIAVSHKNEGIVVDRDVKPGTFAIYDPWSYQLEKDSAEMLQGRLKTASFKGVRQATKEYLQRLALFGTRTEKAAKTKRPRLASVVSVAVDEWGASNKLVLSEDQKRGAVNALLAPVSILTGLPGTGKTTGLRAVVNILQEAGVKFLLCAPTGIAAKNLGALTGASASTIHRAFAARGKRDDQRASTYIGVVGNSSGGLSMSERDEEWGYDQDNPYPAEVVILDEASMLDQHLLYRLLNCTSPKTRLVIVGDAAQLPSVGPGNVLRDMINSGLFPVTDLREIFRQKDTSAIVFAAHDIFRGEVPEYSSSPEFTLIHTRSEDHAQAVILELAQKLYKRRANFQVLSPRHSGTVGVTSLNARLRDLLNPARDGLHEFRLGADSIVREDDRVMVVRNDYKLGVYNGDVGKIVRVDQKAKEIEVKIFGDPVLHVRITFRAAPTTIRLAYSTTIHKAQGLEYDVIVLPIVDSFRHQLQRNLLYTAVTRAKQGVVLVGTPSALTTAVLNDREDQRNTLLRERLNSSCDPSTSAVVCE